MAIYHCSIKAISRGKGRSAVAAAAYRAGEKMLDERTGIEHDYTRKSAVAFSEILLPENAPAEYGNRAVLWNAVEKVETASNARLAREVEVAIPHELNFEQSKELVRGYARAFTYEGMCADYAIHWKDGNHHAHILLTTRPINPDGSWGIKEKKDYALDKNGERIPLLNENGTQKLDSRNRKQWKRELVDTTGWNKREKVKEWRYNWEALANDALQHYASPDIQINADSYAERGIDFIPTIHEGYVARQIEANGGVSELCQYNREVREKNRLLARIMLEVRKLSTVKNSLIAWFKGYRSQHLQEERAEIKRINTANIDAWCEAFPAYPRERFEQLAEQATAMHKIVAYVQTEQGISRGFGTLAEWKLSEAKEHRKQEAAAQATALPPQNASKGENSPQKCSDGVNIPSQPKNGSEGEIERLKDACQEYMIAFCANYDGRTGKAPDRTKLDQADRLSDIGYYMRNVDSEISSYQAKLNRLGALDFKEKKEYKQKIDRAIYQYDKYVRELQDMNVLSYHAYATYAATNPTSRKNFADTASARAIALRNEVEAQTRPAGLPPPDAKREEVAEKRLVALLDAVPANRKATVRAELDRFIKANEPESKNYTLVQMNFKLSKHLRQYCPSAAEQRERERKAQKTYSKSHGRSYG